MDSSLHSLLTSHYTERTSFTRQKQQWGPNTQYGPQNSEETSFEALFHIKMNRFLQMAGTFLESVDQRADRSVNGGSILPP